VRGTVDYLFSGDSGFSLIEVWGNASLGGRRQEAGGRRQEAGGRRQEAGTMIVFPG